MIVDIYWRMHLQRQKSSEIKIEKKPNFFIYFWNDKVVYS
jgi:hypothetical protein